MKSLKIFLFGTLVGVLIGLWIGTNLGKNKPIWTNPFAKGSISEQLQKSRRTNFGEKRDKN